MQITNRLTVLVSLILGVLLVVSCSSKKKNDIDRTLSVKTATVLPYTSQLTVTYPGKIKAQSDVSLAFRVSGPILKVYVNVGSKVKKGQVLAEIDPRDYRTQLNATQAKYNQIKGEAERIMALYEKGSISQNDYEKAKFGLEQITSLLKAHEDALVDTKLIAPFDGYIQKKYFSGGETVSAGLPIVAMINDGLPEVEINIPSTEFYNRDSFDSFECSVDIFPEETFSLQLAGIAHKANLNQLYTMRFYFDQVDLKRVPTPGMTTTVKIFKKTEVSNLTVIPISAVFQRTHDESCVWVYDKDSATVKSRVVVLQGVLRNGTAIVYSGLKADEEIVIAGVHSLRDGDKVVPLPEKSKTNIGDLL